MASKPKTAAEILASAVPAPAPKRRKPRQKNPISYSDQFSVFSVSEDSSTTAFSSSVGENNDEISCVNESNSSFEFVSVITPVLYRELERESRDVEGSTGGYEENYEADMSAFFLKKSYFCIVFNRFYYIFQYNITRKHFKFI